MKLIASKLQYGDWCVAGDSCSRGFGLNNTISRNNKGNMQFGSNVTCKCTSTVCHISRMYESVFIYVYIHIRMYIEG
ncbi:hypothetical protein Hanom_Chr06g00541761 [Helianthus anomalus]